ncbi:hypothetical protein [Microbacterium sp. NPDC087589]|uniref:hypothetical protein n=1 Tax=Microbacterium sp. NPDC087589 TaxID=3364191 RepID=UPI003814E0F5
MTAKQDIEVIKADAALTEAERLWKAIDLLAERVDKAPEAGAKIASQRLDDALRSAF